VGSFLIALGMLVDNAIVITDLFVAKMKKHVDRYEAAVGAVRETGIPLLASTVIAIAGATPVFFAKTDAGEYALSVFQIMCSSLLFSWLTAVTVTPLMCWKWLKVKPAEKDVHGEVKQGWFGTHFSRLIEWNICHPWKVVLLVIPLMAITIWISLLMPMNFMPYSDRPLIFLDYWLPNGSMIEQTAADMAKIEQWLIEQPQVKSVGSFIGQSAPRFSVTVEPEPPDQSYGQFIINTKDYDSISELVKTGNAWLRETFPDAEPRFRNLKLATKDKFNIEVRFAGPDPAVLHELADQAKIIMAGCPLTRYVRDDWRQLSGVLEPIIDQAEMRKTGITRADISANIRRISEGFTVGLLRQKDRLIPVQFRSPNVGPGNLDRLSIRPMMGAQSVPLGQGAAEYKLQAEESMIWRRDRVPAITVQAGVQRGVIPGEVRGQIKDAIEAIELPPGYTMAWGGEYYDARRSVIDVLNQLPKVLLIALVIMLCLFNGFRQPFIILITIPLATTGVVAMLLLTNMPFGFMALVGAVALSAIIIKNGVVLMDQIELERRNGLTIHKAVKVAAIGRTLPISMGALTTMLGMVPLLTDRLFDQMAATIVGGLAVATLLSLIVMPALYMLLFRTENVKEQKNEGLL
jgi:multidrug efflux pump subunit AcrB